MAAGGMTKAKAARSAAGAKSALHIDYKSSPKGKSLESVVFSGQVAANFPKWGIPPVFVIADGITIDVQARESDALATFKERRPGSFTQVVSAGKIPKILAAASR